MSEVQGTLFSAPDHSPIRVVTSAFAKACGDIGPYDLLHYTGTGRPRYRILTCNRPMGHGGLHAWTDQDGQQGRTWDRQGRPAHPIQRLPRSDDGS